ncbi:MAG: hypothetical protein FVQ77_06835 [Cytophagales bacterium]|nr:hypothetical protein [Cytophagales bacterium]
MKQLTLHIPDNKFPFFMELVKSFNFVKVQQEDEPTKEEILASIEQGLKEVKLMQQGKIKKNSLDQLLDEL